jgi:acetylornithine deacetylase/succinyl-diaminopimelate desuccinylase-like protein
MEKITEYIENNRQRFLDELFGLIRIPSISSLSENKSDMHKAAEYWKELIYKAGAKRVEIIETDGNPVVYGEKIIDKKRPTVLVYGHYDVMSVDPLDLWDTSPFEPIIKNEKIYARGADDDKGQAFMHAKAFEFMVSENKLPCNVKFMIEGEEEIGSPSLEKFCEKNKDLLKCDIILVSDTGMIAPDIPSITVGLRGLAYMEVELIGPNRDLHSGIFGGAVANPANILSKLVAQLTDENNKITIPGFYDDVVELSSGERTDLARAPFNLEKYKRALDLKDVNGEKGFSTIERTGIRPSLDVNGIWSGYTGEGAKTVLPAKATAKISMRLVPNQDHHKISKLFEDYLIKIAPPSVKISVKDLHGGSAYVAPTNTIAYEAASKAYQKSFGVNPIPTRSGGSIPVIAMFEKVLGVKSILMGFGLESDAIHSPNENYPLYNFFKGIETIPWFYKYYSELKK